ncbi:arabinosyltransferase XEG113-like [Telopea speciosissima]|uniref:arabinosyltransferase XEG113-like n=1 Tax=Telopea speciosissima TaxID=54955 RepID=UPI001CC55D20|nr:arabinosyltransferase XEG113-like [Telopea speciosissima]
MAWNPFHDISNSKPLFLTIYATVLIGIICSSVYVFSALYGGKTIDPTTLFSPGYSTTQHSTQVDHAPNSELTKRGEAPSLSASKPQRMKPLWELPPPGSKMPPLKTFRLTKELVSDRVKDNVIIVTFGNYAFMDFILNWVKHLTDLGLHNLLVGAMDTKLLEALYWKGVPVFDMESHMSTVDVGWGSPTFHKMGREKVILIDVMLPFGYELLMCDTDMVWLKNPLPYLARYPEADILTSTDQVIPTVVDDRLENWQEGEDCIKGFDDCSCLFHTLRFLVHFFSSQSSVLYKSSVGF